MWEDIFKVKDHKDKIKKFAVWREFGIIHVIIHWKGIVRLTGYRRNYWQT